MKGTIQSVAVLGSGIMGSRIACHFANAGFKVLLLDIAPKDLSEEERKKIEDVMPGFVYWASEESKGRSGEIVYL